MKNLLVLGIRFVTHAVLEIQVLIKESNDG